MPCQIIMATTGMYASCGAFKHCGFMEPARLAVTDAGLGGLILIQYVGWLGKAGVRHLCKVLPDEAIPGSIVAEQ